MPDPVSGHSGPALAAKIYASVWDGMDPSSPIGATASLLLIKGKGFLVSD